jgi:hypothetical protein
MTPYSPTRKDLESIKATAIAELRKRGIVNRAQAKVLKRQHADFALDLLFLYGDVIAVTTVDGRRITIHPHGRVLQ